MIKDLGQVMLYVNNPEESLIFWKDKVKFEKIIKIESQYGGNIYEIAPKKDSQTSLVLHNKEKVKEMNPEMNLETPSILMKTENLEKTYNMLKENGVNVNPIVDLGNFRVFNFSDNENNYFAVTE